MINELPTIFEVVSGNAKQPKDQSATHNNSGKSKSSGKIVRSYGLHSYSISYSFLNVVLFTISLTV